MSHLAYVMCEAEPARLQAAVFQPGATHPVSLPAGFRQRVSATQNSTASGDVDTLLALVEAAEDAYDQLLVDHTEHAAAVLAADARGGRHPLNPVVEGRGAGRGVGRG